MAEREFRGPLSPEYRRRFEDALSAVQFRALTEACADCGRSLDEWPDVPALWAFVFTIAGARTVRRFEGQRLIADSAIAAGAHGVIEAERLSRSQAIKEAAGYLGVDPAALRYRVMRAASEAA